MSRSGYSDGLDSGALNLWRANVWRTISGKRGQAFMRELLAALDALPQKRLQAGILVEEGECCAMGAVAIARKCDVSAIDESEPEEVASAFGISSMLAQEIAYINDEFGSWNGKETPEERFIRVRAWVVKQIPAGTPTKEEGAGE